MPHVKRLISESQDDVIITIITTVIVATVRSVTHCTCSFDKNLVHTKDRKKNCGTFLVKMKHMTLQVKWKDEEQVIFQVFIHSTHDLCLYTGVSINNCTAP